MMKPELKTALLERKNELLEELKAIDTLLGVKVNTEIHETIPKAEKVRWINKADERRSIEREEKRREQFERINNRIASGEKLIAACKAEGTSDANYYNWKKKFAPDKTLSFTLKGKKGKKVNADPYADKPEPNPVTGQFD